MKKCKILLVLFLMLFMLIVQSSSSLVASESEKPLSSVKGVSDYVPFNIIRIFNDSAFSLYGFPGSGTPSSPYLIDGYNITDGSPKLISINDTTSHFIVQNCFLQGQPAFSSIGILLGNVTHGTIANNIVRYLDTGGVFTDNCTEIVISNNTIHGVNTGGIVVTSCENSTISNNRIYNNTIYGILLLETNNVTIIGNTIYDIIEKSFPMGFGIALIDVDRSFIYYNTIYNCSSRGIWLEGNTLLYTPCENNTILGNVIHNCTEAGIYLQATCNDNELSYNTIYNITGYGFILANDSDDNTVNWNSFMNNSGNINHQAYDNCSNNNISFNFWYDHSGVGTYTIAGDTGNTDDHTISTPVPLVVIEDPLETSYETDTINVTLMGNALIYKYYIEGIDIQNITWTPGDERTLADGEYTLHIYASILNSTAYVSVKFIIDADAPTVEITSPTEDTYTQDNITLIYTVSDGVVTVILNGTTNTTAIPSGTVITDIPNGNYNVTILAEDQTGKIGKDSVECIIAASADEDPTSEAGTFPELSVILIFSVILVVVVRKHKKT